MATIQATAQNTTVKFTVKLENATNRDFHWTVIGDGFSSNCVVDGIISGTKTIAGNLVIPITLKTDRSVIDLKNLQMVIRENGPNGSIVATSVLVRVVINIPITTTTTTEPPVVDFIPINVMFNHDGRRAWSVSEGDYDRTIAETDKAELRERLIAEAFEYGQHYYSDDGMPIRGPEATWAPYNIFDYDDFGDPIYERSFFNAAVDGILNVHRDTPNEDVASDIAWMTNEKDRSCVVPFMLQRDIYDEFGDVVGERDFTELDLVAELRVTGFEEYNATWINDPIYNHRAYRRNDDAIMFDCAVYKNIPEVPGKPLAKDLLSEMVSIQPSIVEYWREEGRGYVQIPVYKITDFMYNETIDDYYSAQRRNGFTARMEMLLKDRLTGAVVSGFAFSVMQNGLLTNTLAISSDPWMARNLRAVIGSITRVTELSPIYWKEPQRWIACDDGLAPPRSNIIFAGLEYAYTPIEYITNPEVEPPFDMDYFATPIAFEWPLGMTVKELTFDHNPLSARLHILIRPEVLGDDFFPPFNADNFTVSHFAGEESRLDIFNATQGSVAGWKSDRRNIDDDRLFNIDFIGNNGTMVVLSPRRFSETQDLVLTSMVVINLQNGHWAALDCDITRLPSGHRIRIVGSVVTAFNLD